MEGGVILRDRADQLNGTVDAIARMDSTYLVIQGPPGSGKTFTSAHAIVSLLDKGKRVGVMSMSHKAINNLLKKVEEVAAERGVKFSGIKKSSGAEDYLNGTVIVDSEKNEEACGGDHGLIGGTAWLFSRPEMDQTLDYLFVDEAGQVSLADIVATGLSAKNIVLVGDQMQLGQPTKGKHPGGSGVSGLDYLMGDWATGVNDRRTGRAGGAVPRLAFGIGHGSVADRFAWHGSTPKRDVTKPVTHSGLRHHASDTVSGASTGRLPRWRRLLCLSR